MKKTLEILATAILSALVAYGGVRWQFSRDLEKMKMETSFQGKLEALKIERDRVFRRNKIQELTERANLLNKRLKEDSVLASDSIDRFYYQSLDSFKREVLRKGAPPISYEIMVKDELKKKRNQAKERWAYLRRREIEDILLEVKWLKNLDVVDTLPIPGL